MYWVTGSCAEKRAGSSWGSPASSTHGVLSPLHSHLSFQEKCAQYWPSDGLVSYGDITVELKKEEECESYTVRDLLVTNTRVRWLVDEASPTGKPGCPYLSDDPSSKGEQEQADPAVPLPWLA